MGGSGAYSESINIENEIKEKQIKLLQELDPLQKKELQKLEKDEEEGTDGPEGLDEPCSRHCRYQIFR